VKSKTFCWLANVLVLGLALSTAAVSQNPRPIKLSGIINDYTPVNIGSWEIRGSWSLKLKGDCATADFSAALSMMHSDIAVLGGATRTEHTHHVVLTNGVVTSIANGFRITGPATVTANGAFPPPFGPNSTLQIDITGDKQVEFSNIQVTFINNADGTVSDGTKHFGTQVINGVVKNLKPSHGGDM
jgi:hypothetical protein